MSGKVINSKNEPVAGATVVVEELSKSMIADVEGRFSVLLEPGKKYVITVSSVSYTTKAVSEVEVLPGIDNILEIVLEPAARTGEAVIIRTTRRRESTNALLAFQKNNSALSSGLAADFIRRTPDKNTGEVLKRVSGASIQDNRFVVIRGLSDRYNQATINNAQLPSTEPDKKAFSFDVLPSSLIDNIIINKTATPDMTGEFAGGLVQVNTKDVPAKDQLSVGISLGFNTQSVFTDFFSNPRNNTDWLGFDDGTRSIPTGFPSTAAYRILGINSAGVQQQVDFTRMFNNNVYDISRNKAMPNQTYSLTWGSAKRFKNDGKFGTVLSIIYRKSMLKYQVERRLYQDDGKQLIQLNDEQNKYGVNIGAIANFTYVKGKHKISFKNLFNQLFEDNFYTRGGTSFDRLQEYEFYSSVLNQRTLYSGQLEGEHQLSRNGIKLRWNGNVSYNSKAQPDLRTLAYFRSQGTNEPFEYNDDDTRRFNSDLEDFSYGANGSLLFPFKLKNQNQSFKIGGSVLIRIRDFKSRIFRYVPADMTRFNTAYNTLSYNQIFAGDKIALDGFILEDFTNNQDKYFAVSALDGIYGMFDNKFGEKVRLIWGVRMEFFEQFLTTKDVTNKRIVVNTEKWDLLPSFNFTYSPGAKQNIRVSGSRTVSRPEFREIAPFAFYDYEVNFAINGNPELKRGSILNADIRYEFYPKGGEAITLGAFYKNFRDPIELRLNPSSVLDRRNYEYQNADKAYSVGLELEIRKGLDFLGPSWTPFSFFANLTYISADVTLASVTGSGNAVTANRPLQGQSPYLVNLGVQYNSDNENWNGSLLYNRIGERLALVGIPNLGFPDVFEKPRNQLDFQLARKVFNKRGEVKITWSDILNAEYLFFENIDEKKSYKNGSDRLFYSYKPGSTITIGFTYDFNLKNK